MTIGGSGNIVSGLGGPAGLGELAMPRGDDNSLVVDVSGVFRNGYRIFGQAYAPTLYINTNGTISFHQAVSDYPGGLVDLSGPLIAPFWGDVDTRVDGEGTESGAIWADLDSNSRIFTVTWDDVGAYRRNADVTNRFQLQLYDRGGWRF